MYSNSILRINSSPPFLQPHQSSPSIETSSSSTFEQEAVAALSPSMSIASSPITPMPILTDTYVVSSSIEMDLTSKVVASTSSSSSCTTSTGTAGELLQLSLTTDTYPAETSWTIVNECTGLAELTSPTYEGSTTTYNDEYCLAIGMEYTFTISDSYSDGMCCSYGNGSYDLIYGGVVIKEPGGEFGSSESTPFGSQCLTSSPTTSVRASFYSSSIILLL